MSIPAPLNVNLNNPVQVTNGVDEWIFDDSSWRRHEDPKDAGCDLLALACSMHRQGLKSFEIYEKIQKMVVDDDFVDTSEPCDAQMADEIRRFYGQKLVMVRLSSTELSEFQLIVEFIVSSPVNIYKDSHVRALVKLPVFYEEDLHTRNIIRNYKTVKEGTETQIDCTLQFVDSVKKNVARGTFISWYYATPDNNLLKITTRLDKQDTNYALWKSISRKKKSIKLKARTISRRLPGEVFCAYEITDAVNIDIDF